MSARGRCDRAVAHESAVGRFCCKSRKIPGDVFFERNEAKLCSPSNMAPRPLAKPPVSLSLGDEVPHIFIRESHQQPRKILISGGKRLLQQNLPQADSCSAATNISYPPSLSGLMRTSRTISLLNSPPLQSRDQTRQAPLYRVRHRDRQRQGEARFRGRHRVPCASRQHPSAAYTPWQADCRKWPIGSAGKDCRGLLLPGGPFHLRYGPPDRSAAQRRPLSRGSNPCGYPHKPLVSYRINRQLSVSILPPLMIRAFGAHCQERTHARQQGTLAPPAEDPIGRVNWNSAPLLPSDDAVSRPPWLSTIMRQMASPNPVPSAFVETNALNTFSNCLGSIPGPESCTDTAISSRPRISVLTSNARLRLVIASTALLIRFKTTSCNWPPWPLTSGSSVVNSCRGRTP